ncbi:hypothetical protein [Streptomyces sp. JV180]|uniref:hypothetical protein n=1 Tax=Streptomyces sp. JV180 TaxID=858634 RepID=UPI00168A5078|nr:hypothetical protein [Streptomyces sp. JV180]MBD3549839.1 hypothetical protein [Streptomyces sp. JV180]
MTEIARCFNVPQPFPTGELRLPGNGGAVKVKIKCIEQHGDDVWVLVEAPRWDCWHTQIEIGEPAHEGISPGVEDVWAPSFAVSAEANVYERLRSLYLSAA